VTDSAVYGGPIVTGEAVAVDLRLAGAGSRGVAFIIDIGLQYLLLILLILVADNVLGSLDSSAAQAVYVTANVLIILGYPVLLESLWRGRTIGKLAMGLRVLRDDGGPIRFRHAFVRGLVGVVLDRPGLSLGLLALIPMLVSTRSKRLGDFAAGTVVIQERVPSRVAAPAPMPPELAAWAATLDLTQVGDNLAMEIRQFLARNHQLAPWARQELGGRLYAALTQRIGPPPAGAPPWAVFSAVLAERRRRDIDRYGDRPAPARPATAAVPAGAAAPAAAAAPPAPPATPAPPAGGDGPFAPPS